MTYKHTDCAQVQSVLVQPVPCRHSRGKTVELVLPDWYPVAASFGRTHIHHGIVPNALRALQDGRCPKCLS